MTQKGGLEHRPVPYTSSAERANQTLYFALVMDRRRRESAARPGAILPRSPSTDAGTSEHRPPKARLHTAAAVWWRAFGPRPPIMSNHEPGEGVCDA